MVGKKPSRDKLWRHRRLPSFSYSWSLHQKPLAYYSLADIGRGLRAQVRKISNRDCWEGGTSPTISYLWLLGRGQKSDIFQQKLLERGHEFDNIQPRLLGNGHNSNDVRQRFLGREHKLDNLQQRLLGRGRKSDRQFPPKKIAREGAQVWQSLITLTVQVGAQVRQSLLKLTGKGHNSNHIQQRSLWWEHKSNSI